MRVFYDTCVIQLSLNPSDRDCDDCRKLLDVTTISWTVVLSERTSAESSISEFVKSLLVSLTSSGLTWVEARSADVKRARRANRRHERVLREYGVDAGDRFQIMAAVSHAVERLVTRDEDFVDPANKTSGATGKRVAQLLRSQWNIDVCYPAEAVASLLPTP